MAASHHRITPHTTPVHRELRRHEHHRTHSEHHGEILSKSRHSKQNGTHPSKTSHHSGNPVSNPNVVRHHPVPQNEPGVHAVKSAIKGASLLAASGVLSGAIHPSKTPNSPQPNKSPKSSGPHTVLGDRPNLEGIAAGIVHGTYQPPSTAPSSSTSVPYKGSFSNVLSGVAQGVNPNYAPTVANAPKQKISLAGIAYGAAHGAVPHDPHRAVFIGIGNPPTVTNGSGSNGVYTPQTYDYSHGWTPRNDPNYKAPAYPSTPSWTMQSVAQRISDWWNNFMAPLRS